MKFPKLTARLLVIVILLFLVMAGVSTLTFFFELNGIVERLGRAYTIERARAARSRIADLLEREASLALKLADSPVVKRWMLDERSEALRKAAFEEMDGYRRAFLDSNYFVVVDSSRHYYNQPATGSLAVTTLKESTSTDRWYFDEVSNGKPVVFNLDYDRLIGAAKVWINCLVRSGGRIVGMAGTGIDITDLVARLVRAEGKGASSMLIDDKGVITAHPNIGYLEYNATAGATGKKITVFDLAASSADRQKLESLVEEARSGKIGMAVVNLQGHTSLTAVAPIAEIGWMMVVSVNTSSLISMSDFIPLLVVLLLSLLVALVLIALLMDRMVLKPLGVMTRSAHLVAAGEYDLILPVDRKDEMGTLSSAFNEMAAKVKNYTENLEASVKERTSELIVANAKLSDANRQVMGSIRYARLIQDGLMPSAGILKDRLSSYSYFHRQRDTVGGDFLFLRDLERSDGFLLAVIDCEGHGVPGALMTVMVDSVLRLTVSSGASDDPAAILGRLDGAIRASLRQGSNRTQHVHGGMDIGLCVCLPKHGRLVFAGAGMPLYVRESDGSVRTVPGRKKAIGYAYRHEPQPFESHRLDTAGRAFFLITDGFMDQAGGSAGRAYGTKRFFDRVAVDGTGSLGGISWEKEFDDYRGPYAQRDDVLVIGFAL